MSSFVNLTQIPARFTQTSHVGVRVANFFDGFYRLFVCDKASGWAQTGPAYLTQAEAFANVDRVASEYYT